MSPSSIKSTVAFLSLFLLGCGGGAPPKEVPKITPEKKAELDKAHAETKAKMQESAPAGAEAPK